MSNKFENYSAEEFVKLCFADDSGKEGYSFWENFEKPKLRVDVWKDDCPKIYNYAESYDSLPDPDVNSYNLYEAHIRVWNKQRKNFEKIPEIKRNGKCRCEIITKDEQTILGSDSIMNIYWHQKYRNTPQIMEKICKDEKKMKDEIDKLKERLNLIKEKDVRYFNDDFSLYKKFLWYYLQYANTIGGFILFPRHGYSINQARGMSSRIQDRFDLTLECIRRKYKSGFFVSNNPLFDISEKDTEFFKMFGSFEEYAEFFCLNESYGDKKNWVENGKVLNLMNNQPLDNWDFKKEPLLQDSDKWWIFYRNIMNRLDARNEQIKNLINKK